MPVNIKKFINLENIKNSLDSFKGAIPFDHCIVDGFFTDKFAAQLANEFIPYDSPHWWVYKNDIEDKKACNSWNQFPEATYSTFSYLNSSEFRNLLNEKTGLSLQDDPGLHGGGWHCHDVGGLLNPHLDYSIHPKMGLQRVINIIIYISQELLEEHGGHFGMWDSNKNGQPEQLVQEIAPKFNRAIIFNTTQNSWHGLSRKLTQPNGIYRKSLAIYYLQDPLTGVDPRGRALFAPVAEQRTDKKILEIIKLRSNVDTSKQVYIK